MVGNTAHGMFSYHYFLFQILTMVDHDAFIQLYECHNVITSKSSIISFCSISIWNHSPKLQDIPVV